MEGRLFVSSFPGLGGAAAFDGETALVGASGDDIGGNEDQGAAYVFGRQDEEWVEQAQLVASDGAPFDAFGDAVAIDGDTAVVGTKRADIAGEGDQGAAYVFQRFGDRWTEVQKLVASDGAELDNFGHAVAIEGDTIVVGALSADIEGVSQGAAYVFVEDGGVWFEAQKLFDPDGELADLYGNDVVLQDDTLLVGAFSANIDGDPGRGAAYVYVRSDGTWILEQKLLATDGEDTDLFGSSVALDRDAALVGAWQKDLDGNARQGAAYVFRRTGTSWAEEQRLTASDGQEDGFFGKEAALLENVSLVAAERDFPGNPQQGVVYEFRPVGGAWVEIQSFTAPQGNGIDGFGHSISLSADRVLIAHPGEVAFPPPGGSAWIFLRPILFQDGFESGDTSVWTVTVD